MNHRLGVYWAPMHDPAPALSYIHSLQPPVIRILTEDVNHISQAHAAAPNAIIIPRVWRLDDDNGRAVRELVTNPVGAGEAHARAMIAQVERR